MGSCCVHEEPSPCSLMAERGGIGGGGVGGGSGGRGYMYTYD